jgi:putative transposase
VLVVDTDGTLLCVLVVAANVGDRRCGEQVLKLLRWHFPRVELVWVDAGFDGDAFANLVQSLTRFRPEVEVVRADPDQHGFAVHPRRWVVERTLAWSGRERRLSKEYERLPTSTETFIYLTAIRRNLRLLAAVA